MIAPHIDPYFTGWAEVGEEFQDLMMRIAKWVGKR